MSTLASLVLPLRLLAFMLNVAGVVAAVQDRYGLAIALTVVAGVLWLVSMRAGASRPARRA